MAELNTPTTITVTPVAEPKQAELHLLPCEIQHSGPAAVSTYFKPKPSAEGEAGSFQAAFRGRRLRGEKVVPPPGYVGAVLEDTLEASVADGELRKWVHKTSFDELTLWGHDDAPMADEETLFKAMRWAAVADVLHGDD